MMEELVKIGTVIKFKESYRMTERELLTKILNILYMNIKDISVFPIIKKYLESFLFLSPEDTKENIFYVKAKDKELFTFKNVFTDIRQYIELNLASNQPSIALKEKNNKLIQEILKLKKKQRRMVRRNVNIDKMEDIIHCLKREKNDVVRESLKNKFNLINLRNQYKNLNNEIIKLKEDQERMFKNQMEEKRASFDKTNSFESNDNLLYNYSDIQEVKAENTSLKKTLNNQVKK